MKTYEDIVGVLEFGANEENLHDILEYCEDEPDIKTFKHLKRILNVNTEYLEYIDEDTVSYIAAICPDTNLSKVILITILLKAISENKIVDIEYIKDFLLTFGFPTKKDANLLKRACSSKDEPWHNLWITTYSKM